MIPLSSKLRGAEPPSNDLVASPHIETDQEAGRTSLLLQLDVGAIASRGVLEALGLIGFTPKSEFHITAIDIKKGSINGEVFDLLGEAAQAEVMSTLRGAGASMWQVKLIEEFYLVEKHYEKEEIPRRSIIQLVDCPGLDKLYGSLNLLAPVGAQFEIPPAHITLATQGSARGIGISSEEELHTFGTSFTIPK